MGDYLSYHYHFKKMELNFAGMQIEKVEEIPINESKVTLSLVKHEGIQSLEEAKEASKHTN